MQYQESKDAVVEALEGRLPVLPGMRIYSGYASFLWTCAAVCCASYAYLIGTALATLGNTWVAIVGYWVGTLISLALAMLAVGIPSFRTGLDTVDVAKAALGIRGSLILMVGIVLSCAGWGNVVIAMTARSAGMLVGMIRGAGPAAIDERVVEIVALVLVAAIWWLASKGPQAVASLSRWCVPGQLLVALILLAFLFDKYSPAGVINAHVPNAQLTALDARLQVTLAVEFGLSNGFTMVPFLGGLTRLVARRRILVTPPILGCATGGGFISGVAALATAVTGKTDLFTWVSTTAGPMIGAAIMLFLIVANIGALVAFFYLGGISIQQLGPLSRIPWKFTVALLLAPSVIVAFRTQWMIDAVMQLLTYNGVMFVGVTAVLIADYYIVRNAKIDIPHLFSSSRRGRYWYLGGVNWVAMSVIAAVTFCYFQLFNPVTLQVAPLFQVAGAAIPLVLVGGVTYLALTRVFTKVGRHASRSDVVVDVEI